MLILPDTSAWISYLANLPGPIPDLLGRLIEDDSGICICGPTVMEVLQGLRFKWQERRVTTVFDQCRYLDIDRDTFLHAAGIYRTCRNHGFTIRSNMDCLISATALRHGAHLLHNDRDFDSIARCFSLRML